MQDIFLKVLQMSMTASLIALAVMGVRLLLRNAPKWVICLLWALVALRLVCPVSIESEISLVPEQVATGQIISNVADRPIEDEWVMSVPDGWKAKIPITEGVFYVYTVSNEAAITFGKRFFPVLSRIWVSGVALLLLYSVISYIRLRRSMAEATLLRGNIWQCERVDSPFILGFIRPKIYLPYAITEPDMENVIAHEQAHIRRGDHWWKPIGFLILSVHWFNPVMWVAYILLCRDIEAACDEKVIRNLEMEGVRAYSTALLNCSVHRRRIAACPLAFGEVGVKERIRHVMNYKRPAFWLILTSILVCVIVVACFLTNPMPSREFSMNGVNVRDLDVDTIIGRVQKLEGLDNANPYTNAGNFSLMIDSDFNWANSQTVRYFYDRKQETRSAQLRIFPDDNRYFLTDSSEWPEQNRIYLLQNYLDAIKYLPQEEIRRMAPADRYIVVQVEEGTPADYSRVISYTQNGAEGTYGWLIHLRLEPLHSAAEGYVGTGDEVIHLFYSDATGHSGDLNRLISLVDAIVYNPDCAVSSNPFDFIRCSQDQYNEILTYGSDAVDFFVERLREGGNGLREYVMAVACAELTGVGNKYEGGDWATAQEWLSLYDKGEHGTVIPKVIATDVLSGQQAKLMSFGYSLSTENEDVITCGISPWQGDYGEDETLVLDGVSGQNQILLSAQEATLVGYSVHLPNGTLFDDGTRTHYDSLSHRVIKTNDGICLLPPFQVGEYIYELELVWQDQGITVTYGLKLVMTGKETVFDSLVSRLFERYDDGSHLIAVTFLNKFRVGIGISNQEYYAFQIENLPGGSKRVAISADGESLLEISPEKAPDIFTEIEDRPQVAFSDLEPGGMIIDAEVIVVEHDGAALDYHLSYASQAIILEFGLINSEGNKISREISGGSGEGTIGDIPTGRYHLFVCNAGYVNNLPGETLSAGAAVCDLRVK